MFRFDGGLIGVIQGSDKDYRASCSLGLLLLMGFERISRFLGTRDLWLSTL